VLRERERERDELFEAIKRELEIKAANLAAQKAALQQAIAAAEKRLKYLMEAVEAGESLLKKGLTTRRDLEDRRADLAATQQRITDLTNEIHRQEHQYREAVSQRELDRLGAQFKVNEARRQMELLANAIERDSQVPSPIEGRVIEIKVAPGGLLTAGAPVVAIETEGTSLEAVIYVPADVGKNIKPGMEARVEPRTIKREEYGAIVGKVAYVSAFPMTPEGMTAVLRNDALVKRFAHAGAPYGVVVQLERAPDNISGYRWSSGSGPPVPLSTGTLARAEVTTREQPPIDLVIPIMRRISGIGL
jgi:HlyD family secretion protein